MSRHLRSQSYDVIVAGARVAGASTAMLLARRGLRVLVLERGAYGSDTLSTHALMRAGVRQLERWGMLDAVKASGTPPVRRTVFNYSDESVAIDIKPSPGVDALYAPRRTVLDRLLVDAARGAGAEVRFGIAVKGLDLDSRGRVRGVVARDHDGTTFVARAGMTIGADGVSSTVARAVAAPYTRTGESAAAVAYGYFRGVDVAGYEWIYRPRVGAGLIPTNDGHVLVFAGTTPERFRAELQGDLDRGFHHLLFEADPGVAHRVASAAQTGRLRGYPGIRGYFRKPWGPGWALVGDAGYFKDPLSTHGLSDALRDAELVAGAVIRTIGGVVDDRAMAAYERVRDEISAPLFDATEAIAGFDWTEVELREHLKELSRAMKAENALIDGFDGAAAAA